MCPDTQTHTHNHKNTHTKPEQEQSSSPQLDEKYTSLQRRKMLASTIQFSHTTPSRHKHHHSDIRIYPGHKDNHPHTTQPTNESHHSVRAPCAAPDTQQRTNASDKNRLIAQSCDTHTHPCVLLLEASMPPGCVSTWKFSTTYGSAAPHTDTQQPNPTPSTGNYLTMRGQ